jgi:hypothetical protein
MLITAYPEYIDGFERNISGNINSKIHYGN